MSADYLTEPVGSRSGRLGSSAVNNVASRRDNSLKRGYITLFRDTIIKHIDTEGSNSLDEQPAPGPEPSPRKRLEKSKLVIILVGLPGRGKTYVCNKLAGYLRWLGHKCKHFNVGVYRRETRTSNQEMQDASFFDYTNQEGMKARQLALDNALDDLISWLAAADDNQVAIFDATNSTRERRQYLRSKFHGRFQYMFIESICNDQETLEKNYKLKMRYSPDYQGMDVEQALKDFRERIGQYEKVYESMTDEPTNRDLHFIQLVDMVTGRGHMDINRISGYIPGKIVFFLMQVCKAGVTASRKIWLSRHGESIYNSLGKIGGDAALTSQGHDFAELLPEVLIPRLPQMESIDELVPVSVWTSTLLRTIQTAENLPFPKLRWKALDEIHAGVCDGMTYEEIKQQMPQVHTERKNDKLRYRYPSGESYLDIIQRLEPVVIEAERQKESVVIIGHQAIVRVLYGYFMKVEIEDIPELAIPLHTLIELEPRPDGTMVERRFKVNIKATDPQELFTEAAVPQSTRSPGSAPVSLVNIPPTFPRPPSLKEVQAAAASVDDRFGMNLLADALPTQPKKARDPFKHGVVFAPGVVDNDEPSGSRAMWSMSSCASPADLRPELHDQPSALHNDLGSDKMLDRQSTQPESIPEQTSMELQDDDARPPADAA